MLNVVHVTKEDLQKITSEEIEEFTNNQPAREVLGNEASMFVEFSDKTYQMLGACLETVLLGTTVELTDSMKEDLVAFIGSVDTMHMGIVTKKVNVDETELIGTPLDGPVVQNAPMK